MGVFQLPGGFEVDYSKLTVHRDKVCSQLAKDAPKNSWIILQGGPEKALYATDREPIFRQDSFFLYMFGVLSPDFWGAVEVATGKTVLFMPRLPAEYAVWMGHIPSCEDVQGLYCVDAVKYCDELQSFFEETKPSKVFLLKGQNTDSGTVHQPPEFSFSLESSEVDTDNLWPAMVDARLSKSDLELDLLRWLNKVSSAGHILAMRNTKPGDAEFIIEANFKHYIYTKGGCRLTAYTPICASGPNAAILHYGHVGAPNNRVIGNGEFVLNDMGGEYFGYASDITLTYPSSGEFSPQQRIVYEAVLNAQKRVLAGVKPGVKYSDLHMAAEEEILKGAMALGAVVDPDNEGSQVLIDKGVAAIFMPHGLGHSMGLDTHDVGGYLPGQTRATRRGLKSLRYGRELREGVVFTVEPGLYFVDHLLDDAISSPETAKYFVKDVVDSLRGLGGVRLEDNVICTADGAENMTFVPREIDDLMAVRNGKGWTIPGMGEV